MSAATSLRIATDTDRAKPWTPSDRDRLVFQWVKFEGHTQTWVADQLDIHQTTVSRMVERYEKWIAHGRPGAGGLSHDERLRAARWLTYERNEWILASALRIAGEMEGFTDVTKSTVRHTADKPGQQAEVRTENAVIDRSGVAARFLRLAFRVNMEQLKLIEQEPLPPLDALSSDEWEELLDDDVLPSVVADTEVEASSAGRAAAQQSSADEMTPTAEVAESSAESIKESHMSIPNAVSHSAEGEAPGSAGGPKGMHGTHRNDAKNASKIATNGCEADSYDDLAAISGIYGDAYGVVADSPVSSVGQSAGVTGEVAAASQATG